METKIQKWGNSLGVRLPKHLTLAQSLKEGTSVRIPETKTGIAIEAVKKKHRTLDELLKQFDTKSQHELVDWGADIGEETIEKW